MAMEAIGILETPWGPERIYVEEPFIEVVKRHLGAYRLETCLQNAKLRIPNAEREELIKGVRQVLEIIQASLGTWVAEKDVEELHKAQKQLSVVMVALEELKERSKKCQAKLKKCERAGIKFGSPDLVG